MNGYRVGEETEKKGEQGCGIARSREAVLGDDRTGIPTVDCEGEIQIGLLEGATWSKSPSCVHQVAVTPRLEISSLLLYNPSSSSSTWLNLSP